MKALDRILESARRRPMRIALSEADDPRVLAAAARATRDGIAHVVLVGARAAIHAAAARDGVSLDGMALVDPAASASRDAYADTLHALRKNKGMTADAARDAVLDPLCHANLMVRLGDADGSVAGAVHATADVVRAAIQLIGVDPAFRLVSSFFLMMLCEPFHTIKGGLIFSDCALVVDPDAEQLAEIAMAAADSAQALLGEAPRVAMLSFSTSGSAHHAAVDKVTAATERVRAQRPTLAIDGDVQLDAAIVAEIAERKIVHSQVGGHANVLVFPSLEAGNIGYKLAERIGRAKAVGPLLQGLRRPANDLSRGCSADDVYHVIAATTVQAQAAAQRIAASEAAPA
ncbi:phosphate acetyltransferase [Burkholderia multivorans]|uniref:phosphate acetyltransferase n=1 Tax=Burkholderia multivorans TaxID=87883 RepID=UPI0006A5DA54|nr:phosphate acetyltransferase [Burkholderia multivorans]KOE23204.1 phosphate acetyltransferase [Burkholderia multivorans R-20526]MBU9243195.1 phosphate acetyltransferase [Burkholderia multivorans]MCO7336932.1 phosphate acetyltransferase [Burkholderia multivorans]MCO7343617.1 phosphate acetyltransferase [Burkholderia multivorans]MCO7349246.1 phosphate acetyltransferase [Burkholderia multivorans]